MLDKLLCLFGFHIKVNEKGVDVSFHNYKISKSLRLTACFCKRKNCKWYKLKMEVVPCAVNTLENEIVSHSFPDTCSRYTFQVYKGDWF